MTNRKKAPAHDEIVEMEKWHAPDWREIDKYPADWQQLTADQKKWEFLRRHKPYRDDWNEASDPSAQKLIAEKYSLKILVDPKLDWRKLPKGFGLMYVVMMGSSSRRHAAVTHP